MWRAFLIGHLRAVPVGGGRAAGGQAAGFAAGATAADQRDHGGGQDNGCRGEYSRIGEPDAERTEYALGGKRRPCAADDRHQHDADPDEEGVGGDFDTYWTWHEKQEFTRSRQARYRDQLTTAA
ncbi:hypothetical protein [Kitasatospora aureofaciens]|uniref:hypothetical protein n=1 Tax=Kitasatospora aureofaciens TaxID=1894 RepID=UPI0036F472F6